MTTRQRITINLTSMIWVQTFKFIVQIFAPSVISTRDLALLWSLTSMLSSQLKRLGE